MKTLMKASLIAKWSLHIFCIFPERIHCIGMKLFLCVVTHENTLMLGAVHEHKQALAWQALSHAKGHYLAAVSFNRSVAGWETDPGSVPSLRGCTIWQLQHIRMSVARVRVRTHSPACKCLCVKGGNCVSDPLWEKSLLPLVPLQCPFSLLSIWLCVCACVLRLSDSDGGIQCGELLMKTDFKGWLCHFTARRNKKTEGRRKRQTNAFTHTHANISTYECWFI